MGVASMCSLWQGCARIGDTVVRYGDRYIVRTHLHRYEAATGLQLTGASERIDAPALLRARVAVQKVRSLARREGAQ